VHFSSLVSWAFGTPDFPVTDVPFQAIIDRVANGTYKGKPAKVFRFEEIGQAHRLIEANEANGKMVVRL
jgi:NADPH2:quinone reductase